MPEISATVLNEIFTRLTKLEDAYRQQNTAIQEQYVDLVWVNVFRDGLNYLFSKPYQTKELALSAIGNNPLYLCTHAIEIPL